MRGRMADADLFVRMAKGPPLEAGEEFLLELVGKLQADGVVFFGRLIADVSRVGPGGIRVVGGEMEVGGVLSPEGGWGRRSGDLGVSGGRGKCSQGNVGRQTR